MSPDESQRGRSDGGGADSPDDGGVYRPFAPGGGRRFPSAPEEVERAAPDPGNRKRAYQTTRLLNCVFRACNFSVF